MSLVETGRDGALPAEIEPGDRISVVDAHGALVALDVTAVGADFVEGSADGDGPIRIPAHDIRELRMESAAPGRTAALAAGLAFGIFVQALSNGAVGAW